MAQVRILCPACQATLTLNHPWRQGLQARCPHCQMHFALPDARQFAASIEPTVDPRYRHSFDGVAAAGEFEQPWSDAPQRYSGYAPAPSGLSSGTKLLLGFGLAAVGIMVGTAIVLAMVVILDSGPAPVAQNQAAAPNPPVAQPAAAPAAPEAVAAQSSPMPAQPLASGAAPATSQFPPAAPPGSTPVSQSPPAAAGPVLAYRWNQGEEYLYFFNIKAEIAGAPDSSNGTVTLTAANGGANQPAQPVELQQGSGTGFLVTSDGYLVTCAHVVENATKIDVIAAGQTLSGQVVALDKPHDLAIVRVQAANLPVLTLANSDAVQLAQEVRAVGFPLSNVLGESVKITRGTVSGMVNSEGRRLFQVDASINPGNSGGPLVDETGRVVGVASAKLAGEDIDGVGFAVISNDVQTLLNAHRIPYQAAQAGARLDGPELARRVTPAVVMLKVTIASGAQGRRQALDFHGSVSTTKQREMGFGRRMTMPGFPEFDRGRLVTTEFGELVEATGEAQLPYLFGALGPLTIEPLSASGERTWRSERGVALTQTVEEESPTGMPFHFRRPRGFRHPFASQSKVVVTPAMETAQYEILQSGGDQWQIKKRYAFKTLGQQSGQAAFEINGEGVLVFNQKGGYAEKLDYRANLVRSSNNVTVTIPVTLAWHRATAAELADIKRRASEAEAKRKADEAAAAQPPTPDEMRQLLADLAPGRDGSQKRQALDKLKKKQPVDAMRAQLMQAVSPLTQDSDAWVREAAIGVMGAWGTKETVPVLVKLLDQFDSGVRRATIEALGKIKDASAAEALAPLLANQSDQHEAARALEALGEIAEPAVLPMLTHADRQVRFNVCRLLGKIGGKDSVAAIKKLLLREQDGLAKLGAEGALRELGKKGL